MMILVRTNLVKGTDDALDFENNYKNYVNVISKLIFAGGVIFIKNVDYQTFKSMIDGEAIKWEYVKLREDKNNYELWLEVSN